MNDVASEVACRAEARFVRQFQFLQRATSGA
jgi:hypothetical protein